MNTASLENLAPVEARATRNGAETLLDTLVANDIDTIFGGPGGAALPLYGALHSTDSASVVLVRKEATKAQWACLLESRPNRSA